MRCVWCNKPADASRAVTVTVTNLLGLKPRTTTVVVHPEHEPMARSFLDELARRSKYFVLAIALWAVWIVMGAPLIAGTGEEVWRLRAGLTYGATLAALSVIMWVWPFATSVTVGGLGLRTSIVMVRAASLVVLLLAIGFVWWGTAT